MSEETKRVTFFITFDEDRALIERIDAFARRNDMTRSAIIRRALRLFLEASPTDRTIQPIAETVEAN